MKHAALLIALLLTTQSAHADGELDSLLRPQDKQALASFADTKSIALADAKANGSAENVKILNDALDGNPLPLSGSYDPTGNWSCRTIKLGGLTHLVVYQKFSCTISDDGAGWFLKKRTGSQRTEGRFYTNSDTQLTYLGATFVAGDKPGRYGPDNKQSHVALVERPANNRLVLQFPKPVYESDFDILVLERP